MPGGGGEVGGMHEETVTVVGSETVIVVGLQV